MIHIVPIIKAKTSLITGPTAFCRAPVAIQGRAGKGRMLEIQESSLTRYWPPSITLKDFMALQTHLCPVHSLNTIEFKDKAVWRGEPLEDQNILLRSFLQVRDCPGDGLETGDQGSLSGNLGQISCRNRDNRFIMREFVTGRGDGPGKNFGKVSLSSHFRNLGAAQSGRG